MEITVNYNTSSQNNSKKASSQTDDVQLFSEGALHEDRRADGKSEISLVIMAKLWLPHLNGARTSFE